MDKNSLLLNFRSRKEFEQFSGEFNTDDANLVNIVETETNSFLSMDVFHQSTEYSKVRGMCNLNKNSSLKEFFVA